MLGCWSARALRALGGLGFWRGGGVRREGRSDRGAKMLRWGGCGKAARPARLLWGGEGEGVAGLLVVGVLGVLWRRGCRRGFVGCREAAISLRASLSALCVWNRKLQTQEGGSGQFLYPSNASLVLLSLSCDLGEFFLIFSCPPAPKGALFDHAARPTASLRGQRNAQGAFQPSAGSEGGPVLRPWRPPTA